MSTIQRTSLNRILNRNAVFFSLVILLSALWGFWPGYFSDPIPHDFYIHFHGIVLTLWLVTLAAQGYLVRVNLRAIHRRVGSSVYILAPLVILSTLGVIHHGRADPETARALFGMGNQLINLLLFTITAGLGIYYRHEPTVHARFMLCTPLPMFSPIFGRVIGQNFPSVVTVLPLPVIDGRPVLQAASYFAADFILAGLAVWDWVSHRRLKAFPVLCAVFVVTHLTLFQIYEHEWFRSFLIWFLDLPLA